jgi:hypothetical protein
MDSVDESYFLPAPGFFLKNKEVSTPPPCGFLIGIYLFYEHWSTDQLKNGVRSILLALPPHEGSWVESLSFILPVFHESFLLTPALSPESEEISTPLPCGFLIGIYLFYESWSTETF